MNNRQWKKACKLAAAELEREFPGEFVCAPAEGDECVSAPRDYVPPRNEQDSPASFRRSHATPPRGTPLVWQRTSYEYDEWDARTALDMLADLRHARDYDWDAEAKRQGYSEHNGT
jgi:hypothetical protein